MSARDFARRHVLHNFGLKLTSLILATGLWLAVTSSPPAEIALKVPIIFRNMPADLEISSQDIPEVQIRVRGPERMVRRLQVSDLHAEINLAEMKPGERRFDLTKAISVPDRLEVAEVVPSEVYLVFDTRATRQIPVKPRVTGDPASGYHVGEIVCDPATVEVAGPKKQIDATESATTDPIEVSGALDRITVNRAAYVSDPLIQVTTPAPVRVTITMQKEAPSR